MVYDDRIGPRPRETIPRWRRWAPAGGGWTEPAPGTFARRQTRRLDRAAVPPRRPDPEQWQAIREGQDAERRPSADLDHRFLLVQHRPEPARQAPASVGGPAMVPAALGRRPDALVSRERHASGGPSAARADQGRPVQPLRDRPGDRPGAALPRTIRRSVTAAATPLAAAGRTGWSLPTSTTG